MNVVVTLHEPWLPPLHKPLPTNFFKGLAFGNIITHHEITDDARLLFAFILRGEGRGSHGNLLLSLSRDQKAYVAEHEQEDDEVEAKTMVVHEKSVAVLTINVMIHSLFLTSD